MTEFGKNWVGWDFKTDYGDIAEVMLDPGGGLALVEVDAKPKELVAKLGAAAAADLAYIADNARCLYAEQSSEAGGNWMSKNFPALAEDIEQFRRTLPDVMSSAVDTLGGWMHDEARLQFIYGLRHRHNGHVDDGVLTAWCGADQPGFFVVRDGKKIQIPEIPESHVLLMRGENASGPDLPGLRHGVVYRSSKVRRAVLLGY
jgi:hypothetical protein